MTEIPLTLYWKERNINCKANATEIQAVCFRLSNAREEAKSRLGGGIAGIMQEKFSLSLSWVTAWTTDCHCHFDLAHVGFVRAGFELSIFESVTIKGRLADDRFA